MEPDSIIEIDDEVEENHTEDMCDLCGKEIGKENLRRFPFWYKDYNDKHHDDLGDGYRQYYGCDECVKGQERKNG